VTEDVVTIPERVTRRQQLSEEVASYVRELIISGQVRPGDFLRMERIADDIGVSNTPVREGLLSLRSEGLVELVPRRGFLVAAFSQQDVRDLFWAQAQLAGELAARAARKITQAQIAELEMISDRYEAAIAAADDDRIAECGHAFHRAINRAADSQRLASLLSTMVRQLPNLFYATIEVRASAGDVHQLLIEALRTRDARTAKSLMKRHIGARVDYLIELLDDRASPVAAEN
jgi:DNA-binding GntR family transcriptional regulator